MAGDGRGELGPVPPVLPSQSVGDCHIVQPVSRIGVYAAIDQRGEHGAGHRGGIPARRVVTWPRQRRAVRRYLRLCREPPLGQRPAPGGGHQRRAVVGGDRDGLVERCLGTRQGPRVLRREQPGGVRHLHRPGWAASIEHGQRRIVPRGGEVADLVRRHCPAIEREAHQTPAERREAGDGARCEPQFGGHERRSRRGGADLGPTDIEMDAHAIRYGSEKAPAARRGGGGGCLHQPRTVPIPRPARRDREIARCTRSADAPDQYRACIVVPRFDPAVQRPTSTAARPPAAAGKRARVTIASLREIDIERTERGYRLRPGRGYRDQQKYRRKHRSPQSDHPAPPTATSGFIPRSLRLLLSLTQPATACIC